MQNRMPIMLRGVALLVAPYIVTIWVVSTLFHNPLHAALVSGAAVSGLVAAFVLKPAWTRLVPESKEEPSQFVSVMAAPIGAVFMMLAWNAIPGYKPITLQTPFMAFLLFWCAVVFMLLVGAQAERVAWLRVGKGQPAYDSNGGPRRRKEDGVIFGAHDRVDDDDRFYESWLPSGEYSYDWTDWTDWSRSDDD